MVASGFDSRGRGPRRKMSIYSAGDGAGFLYRVVDTRARYILGLYLAESEQEAKEKACQEFGYELEDPAVEVKKLWE
jgi:hypothetical protein